MDLALEIGGMPIHRSYLQGGFVLLFPATLIALALAALDPALAIRGGVARGGRPARPLAAATGGTRDVE